MTKSIIYLSTIPRPYQNFLSFDRCVVYHIAPWLKLPLVYKWTCFTLSNKCTLIEKTLNLLYCIYTVLIMFTNDKTRTIAHAQDSENVYRKNPNIEISYVFLQPATMNNLNLKKVRDTVCH